MHTTLAPAMAAGRRANVLWSNLALAVLAVVALLVHSYNMFGFPLYQSDEGTYMAQAYATLKLGQLTPYAYWYDHAPAGWILIAAWTVFTGGFHTFGTTAIDGGRVLMLLLHVVSAVLLFRIALRLTGNTFVALASGLLYALSPLGVFYGRMVLLDNIMVFWALLATVLLLRHNGKIWPLLYSGGCFGVAVLTKENAIFLLPAFIYGLWTMVERNHARFARAGWLFAAISTISLYPLYAALRKELVDLSFSTPLAGGGGPVSLVGTFFWQMSRNGGAPWDPSSDFYRQLTTDWLVKDPWLLGLGAAAIFWNLVHSDHRRRLVGLLALLSIVGIARGSVTYGFYIIPILPFLALNVGLAIEDIAQVARAAALLPATVIAAAALGGMNLYTPRAGFNPPDMFTLKLTRIQHAALAWIQEHVPAEAQLVISDELWVDLRDGARGKPAFPGAHAHSKVAYDPAVYHTLFNDDWRSIDYVVLAPGTTEIFEQQKDRLTYAASSRATPVARFALGEAAVEIRRVNNPGLATQDALQRTYRSFRERFIDHGQVRTARGYTDARDQATAMLMAVWMDDQETFNELWNWTRTHLQGRNGLLYQSNEPGAPLRSTTAADTDAALALLLAQRRWDDASYGRYGTQLVQAIWRHEVVEIEGKPYLAAGDWAVDAERVIFAPATFTPYAYHFFAEADPSHNWWYLLDTGYKLLNSVTSDRLGEERSARLPPAYVAIDRATQAISANPDGAPGAGNRFDAEAAHVYWRVGLDAQWHDDQRADRFLQASRFLLDAWNTSGRLAASYTHAGKPGSDEAGLIMYSAVMPQFLIQDPAAAHKLYATKIAATFSQAANEGQWGDGEDVAQQRWAWLTTGLYLNALQYQWDDGK